MSKFIVRWECEDSYVGKSRPQSFALDMDDMAQSCTTVAEAEKYLDAEVATDFQNKITTCVKNRDEVIEEWRAQRKALTGEEQP